jgi:cyanophycinase
MYPGVTKASDDEVYSLIINATQGGDVLVLTADEPPCDIYNDFIYRNLSVPVASPPNSVTTICFTARDGAMLPKTEELLKGASAVFLTGGDQSKYFDFWRDSPVSRLLPRVPVVAGSSAGLAVQGQFVFDAADGGVDSADALRYPMDDDVATALTNDLFALPRMSGVLTDTHFFQRDRMGRLLAFLANVEARWVTQGEEDRVLGVAVSEHPAVVVERATGEAHMRGVGPAYFVRPGHRAQTLRRGAPLEYRDVRLSRWTNASAASARFSFADWSSEGLDQYNISAQRGKLSSTQRGGGIY